MGDSGIGPWLRLPNPGPVCGRALLREFEMKRERKPIFVERRPNNQEFNIRFALVSGKPLLPAEIEECASLPPLDNPTAFFSHELDNSSSMRSD